MFKNKSIFSSGCKNFHQNCNSFEFGPVVQECINLDQWFRRILSSYKGFIQFLALVAIFLHGAEPNEAVQF